MRDLRFWRWRRAEDDDLDREIQSHLDLATEEHMNEGLPTCDARLAAHRDFGSIALTKEELRDMRPSAILDHVGRAHVDWCWCAGTGAGRSRDTVTSAAASHQRGTGPVVHGRRRRAWCIACRRDLVWFVGEAVRF